MKITKIRIANFKSFADETVELSDFNLLVGPNASGKSNFVQALKFLQDIAVHGLENAISEQGGLRFLKNLKIASEEPLTFHVVIQCENSKDSIDWMMPLRVEDSKSATTIQSVDVHIHSVEYTFSLKFHKRRENFTIVQDVMKLTFRRESYSGEESEPDDPHLEEIQLSNVSGKLKVKTPELKGPFPFFDNFPIPKKSLLIETPFALMFTGRALQWFREVGFYDFDPKVIKKSAIPIAGRSDLEMDGSNLAVILNRLLRDNESKRRFLNLCQNALPFVDNLGTARVADRSVYIKLHEKYIEDKHLPAFLVSDGTVNVVALIAALYFQERKRVAVIEEPERNVHPFLLSRVMEMFEEASQSKQILATSHNPEVVKYTGIENVLLASRDGDGFTRITRPAVSEHVKVFLENELGVEDLFVDNLLGV